MRARINIRLVKTLTPEAKPYEIVDDQINGFLLRVQPSGIMTYYLSYHNAQRKRRRYKIARHGSLTPMQARDIAQSLSAQIASGNDIQAIKSQITAMITLEDFLDRKYAPWVLTERKSGRDTLQMIRTNFKHLLSTPLADIKPWVIEKWRTQELQRGKLASTINRNVTSIKAALSKAVEWEIIETHPLTKLKMLSVDSNKKVRYLSKEEEGNLREALKKRDKKLRFMRKSANNWRRERKHSLLPDFNQCAFVDYLEPMVLISINTGLRKGELFNLTWEDVDLNGRNLTIRGESAKSGRTRHIPLNTEALETLKKWQEQPYLHANNRIFPGKNGKRLDNVDKAWASLLNMANIKDFRWHDMRHHFASKLVMVEVDLNTVRELLGHASLTMTLRYAHLAPAHKIKAVEKISGHS